MHLLTYLRPLIVLQTTTTTRSLVLRTAALSAHPTAHTRQYHKTLLALLPYKDDQDRQTLKPKSTDSTKSGTDDDVAHTNVAFDPSKTRPETEKKAAGEEQAAKRGDKKKENVNPLDASPANQDISKPQGDHGKAG